MPVRLSLAELRRKGVKIAAITPLTPLAQAVSRVRAGLTPHDLLWQAVYADCPSAVREYEDAVPGRKFRIDIALPEYRVAIEVDGWEWHGKHSGDFKRDRLRQNLLVLHGWRVLRFTAADIRQQMPAVMTTIHLSCRSAVAHGDSQRMTA